MKKLREVSELQAKGYAHMHVHNFYLRGHCLQDLHLMVIPTALKC